MKTNNVLKMAALTAVISTGFISCSNDDEADVTIVNGTQAALNQACDDWKVARANWENTEAFLFGAADVYSIDPHTDTWPVAANDLADVLRDATAMSNLDNFIKTANSGILGYHGLEYVLFRQGAPRDINQITNLEYDYICAVAKDLYHATATLEAAWDSKESNAERHQIALDYVATHNSINDDGDVEGALDGFQNFGRAFKNPGTGDWATALDATLEIISGCQDIIGEVGDSKIGLPFTGQDATYIESPYAYNSITDFYDNIISCKNALYGSMNAVTPNQNSVIYFCQNAGNATLKTQANTAVSKLDNALAKIKAMKAPFAVNYSDASCNDAIEALGELDAALDEMAETLKAYAGNATVEQQCKVINENYVDNVVLATYRTLADNAQKLYNSIVKIKK
ncbi:imelysin family protein [Xylanibacter brevis]|uniref:imelysin family protein n=1 Tax=Xylanibacter brevis TaxID=83231 RepID=UPI0009DFD20C|nr:imelysin family protein [Xylanibacter brevis]